MLSDGTSSFLNPSLEHQVWSEKAPIQFLPLISRNKNYEKQPYKAEFPASFLTGEG